MSSWDEGIPVIFTAEGEVEIRFPQGGFSVRPRDQEITLMIPEGSQFEVAIGGCAPIRLVARRGAECVGEYRGPIFGDLVGAVRVRGADRADDDRG